MALGSPGTGLELVGQHQRVAGSPIQYPSLTLWRWSDSPQASFPAHIQLWGKNEEGLIREIEKRKIGKSGGAGVGGGSYSHPKN